MTTGLVQGPDGRLRCAWGASTPDYLSYHDEEWGKPVRDEVGLFERLTLEAFQSGLSWITILRKRPAFRAAFAGFDPAAVAAFGERDVERLLGDAGIVRNRLKIEAAISNARALLDLHAAGSTLSEVFWAAAPATPVVPTSMSEVPTTTPESVALAKSLRSKGFRFLGPTTLYAAMQACGVVNDHVVGCVAR